MKIIKRPATVEDKEFLYSLNKTVYKTLVVLPTKGKAILVMVAGSRELNLKKLAAERKKAVESGEFFIFAAADEMSKTDKMLYRADRIHKRIK